MPLVRDLDAVLESFVHGEGALTEVDVAQRGVAANLLLAYARKQAAACEGRWPDTRRTGDSRIVLDEEQQLIAKLRKVEALFSRPGSDGERRAAESASTRLRARLASLESVEPAVEYRFTLADTWSRSLFIALLRRHDLKPYRYSGQRRTTVMVRVAKNYVETTLWPEFTQFQALLHEHFATVTTRVIGQALGGGDGEVEVREEPGVASARLE